MTTINLSIATKLVTTIGAALALTTPAFALDVQIQEGTAVNFPSEKENIAWGTASPKEWGLAVAQWKKEISQGDHATIVSKIIKSGNGNYFISSGDMIKCESTIADGIGNSWPACKAKIIISNDSSFPSAAAIDVGTICVETLGDFEGGLQDNPLKQTNVYPEIAFDSKNRTFYTRQRTSEYYPKPCNRKITLSQ